MPGAVAAPSENSEVALADGAEQVRQVHQPVGDNVGSAFGVPYAAVADDHAGGKDQAALLSELAGPDDQVGDAELLSHHHSFKDDRAAAKALPKNARAAE